MTIDPKEILDALEREEIDKSTAVDLLIYLIGNNDLIELREESIKSLQRIGVKNSKVFSVLENVFLSDPNQEIRKLGVESLTALFQEKVLPPLKWALDHEKSWELLLLIVSIIRDINNSNAKAILYEKIKKIRNYKFIKNLGSLLKTQELNSVDINKLEEIIKNYIIANELEETLKEVNYQVEEGLIVELNLSFASNNIFGWKILKNLNEFIAFLGKLRFLELKSNNLRKVPDTVFSLNSLKYLGLSYNNINKLPDQFNALNSLENLNLRYNQLTEIPPSIGALKNLKVLDLKHNKITSLPHPIGKLSSLEVLNLHGNQLETIPSSLKELSSLKTLKLALNNLKAVPKWIENLESLNKLSLGGNKSLSDMRKWISYLPSIKELNLYDNDIHELPETFSSLTSLEILVLPNNHISTLPESFKNLTSLKKLDLSWNNITHLPEWIDSLSSLEELNLRGNKLSTLPKSIYLLPSLKALNVSLNRNIIYPPKDLEKTDLEIIF